MNFSKRAQIISPFLRIFVGMILIYSGYIKIIEPVEVFYNSIISYKVIEGKTAYFVALILPWFELYLGSFVLLGLFERYVLILSISLFCLFEVLLLQAIIRGLEITNCGCFGARNSNSINVEFSLNLIWLLFLFLSYKFRSSFSLDNLIERKFNK